MKNLIYVILILLNFHLCEKNLYAENYILSGNQISIIQYRMYQKVIPTSETVTLNLSYVIPESFDSPTYSQRISDFNINFTQEPEEKKEWVDKRGNRVLDYAWTNPRQPIEAEIIFQAQNLVALEKVVSETSFPLGTLSAEVEPYLVSTEMVTANEENIRDLSTEIVSEAKTEYEAVHKILSWVIDHVNYVLDPVEFSAVYSLRTGRGNCQNFSHLAAALMRAQGIPVRVVNGITLKEPYDVQLENRILTLNMAQGRHSWIEVYFPDLGWMPFDPQQSETFR